VDPDGLSLRQVGKVWFTKSILEHSPFGRVGGREKDKVWQKVPRSIPAFGQKAQVQVKLPRSMSKTVWVANSTIFTSTTTQLPTVSLNMSSTPDIIPPARHHLPLVSTPVHHLTSKVSCTHGNSSLTAPLPLTVHSDTPA
jgi:hypothetical protein